MKSLKLYDDLLTSTKAVRLNPGASSRLAGQRGPLMNDNKRLLWLLNPLTATVHVMNGWLFNVLPKGMFNESTNIYKA